MIKDYLQDALWDLLPNHPNWYGFAKVDSNGNKIPNEQRMQVEHVIVNKENEGLVTRPTDEEINAKITELQNAEPMRLLRQERDRRLAETDWMSFSDSPTMTDDWKNYRQALRDLPSVAEPQLDENGQLTNVTWPTKPE